MTTAQLEWLEHFRVTREIASPGARRLQLQMWERQQELGRGAFGVVYLERDARSGKLRAVKEISKGPNRDSKAELIALTRLSRPAYADYFGQFLGWYDDPTAVSLLMEYFELGDLRKHMHDRLPEREARDIILQLLMGLQAMHKDGFAHRDLKPENVFVVQKTPTWQVKIGDFGVSKRIQDDGTQLQTQVGTRHYIAPEVADLLPNKSESVAYKNVVDIWAVGIILYELLCAKRPFPSAREVRDYCYMDLDFPEAALRRNRVSSSCTSLLLRLLTPEPTCRPDSSTALEVKWFDEYHETTSSLMNEPIAGPRQEGVWSPQDTSIANSRAVAFQLDLLQDPTRKPDTKRIARRTDNQITGNPHTNDLAPPTTRAMPFHGGTSNIGETLIYSGPGENHVTIADHGKLLASRFDNETVRIWDAKTGAVVKTLEGHSKVVVSMAFSPNGKLLASGSSDTTVRIWDTTTGAVVKTLEGHLGPVFSVAFSPDGKLLASGSNNMKVRIWDMTTGAVVKTLEGHSGAVLSVAFSPNGKLLASGSDDKTVRIWMRRRERQLIRSRATRPPLARWRSRRLGERIDGSVMVIPRERKLVRLYIQLTTTNNSAGDKFDRTKINPGVILASAQRIIAPYKLDYRYCDWWTAYQIGQRVGDRFSHQNRVFLAGDAVHTHSPKGGSGHECEHARQ